MMLCSSSLLPSYATNHLYTKTLIKCLPVPISTPNLFNVAYCGKASYLRTRLCIEKLIFLSFSTMKEPVIKCNLLLTSSRPPKLTVVFNGQETENYHRFFQNEIHTCQIGSSEAHFTVKCKGLILGSYNTHLFRHMHDLFIGHCGASHILHRKRVSHDALIITYSRECDQHCLTANNTDWNIHLSVNKKAIRLK